SRTLTVESACGAGRGSFWNINRKVRGFESRPRLYAGRRSAWPRAHVCVLCRSGSQADSIPPVSCEGRASFCLYEAPNRRAVRLGTARPPSPLTGRAVATPNTTERKREEGEVSKFSGTKRRPRRVNPTAFVRTTNQLTLTHEGGDALARDPESELF